MEVIVLILTAAIYFIPSLVATTRRVRNQVQIIALNFLLGWTFLGWVVALVWALSPDVEPPPEKRLVGKIDRRLSPKSWLTLAVIAVLIVLAAINDLLK